MKGNNKSHKLRIFLCHSSGDKERVYEIYKKLRNDKFEPWLDDKDLLGGQNWEQEIQKAVRNSDVILACLSCGSIIKSSYVQEEIKLALEVGNRQPKGTNFLIPLKLEDCELPEQLKHCNAVKYYEKRGYADLKKALLFRAVTLEQNRLASSAVQWISSGALLIFLFVAIYLLPTPPNNSAAIPPKSNIEIPQDGIAIHNKNDDPIRNLKVYLITYKINKMRFDLTYSQRPHPMDRQDFEPGEYTMTQTRKLVSDAKLVPLESTSNSGEIIFYALVMTFSCNQNNYIELKPFYVATNPNGESVLYPLSNYNGRELTDAQRNDTVKNIKKEVNTDFNEKSLFFKNEYEWILTDDD
ncbi:MAG TPA: toll/interleukin-1 receptor domain-containing protein [Pyrinomonadaceae bacterium]